jgi:hypothetical protein
MDLNINFKFFFLIFKIYTQFQFKVGLWSQLVSVLESTKRPGLKPYYFDPHSYFLTQTPRLRLEAESLLSMKLYLHVIFVRIDSNRLIETTFFNIEHVEYCQGSG